MTDPDHLYNLGLCYVDLGQLDQGKELLHRCLELAPKHSNACVTLGIAYQKKGDLDPSQGSHQPGNGH